MISRPARIVLDPHRASVARKIQGKVSVVVADELTLLCEGVAAICELTAQYCVVRHCRDGTAAVEAIESRKPEIAVLDLNLPGLYGLAVVRKVRRLELPVKLIIVSTRRDRKTVLEVLRAGADGFLLKSDPASGLIQAFEQVLAGEVYISPQLQLTDLFQPGGPRATGDPFETLSPREYQVFTLLVEGLRAKEIAARLDLSPKTVDTYRSSLMRKLGIYSLAGLVKFAVRNKLTQ